MQCKYEMDLFTDITIIHVLNSTWYDPFTYCPENVYFVYCIIVTKRLSLELPVDSEKSLCIW